MLIFGNTGRPYQRPLLSQLNYTQVLYWTCNQGTRSELRWKNEIPPIEFLHEHYMPMCCWDDLPLTCRRFIHFDAASVTIPAHLWLHADELSFLWLCLKIKIFFLIILLLLSQRLPLVPLLPSKDRMKNGVHDNEPHLVTQALPPGSYHANFNRSMLDRPRSALEILRALL